MVGGSITLMHDLITLRMKERGLFCVYSHSVGGKVIYVGSGSPSRAFIWKSRNDRWGAIVKGRQVTMRILSWHRHQHGAYLEEQHMIRTLKPSCNLSRYGKDPQYYGDALQRRKERK